MWIKDPDDGTGYNMRTHIIGLINTDSQETITVASEDADKVLDLIQQRFVKTVASNKVYIIDTTDELVGIPTNLKADELTPEDEKRINDWLKYLNRG